MDKKIPAYGMGAPCSYETSQPDELEGEGCALLRQYGFAVRMNKPLAAFLRKVAARLGWQEFSKLL